ncbi:MAG: type IV toxin-antitoxin system AbiEi family antitoxin domain-containing protein [Gemmataceae bacterium]|nr:type IV toxin-antitoxin system AbiEi family antitoxin domain-containing protein [Gemmataceae bacterium]
MSATNHHEQRVLGLARKAGVVRPRDLAAQGIPREYLIRLRNRGVLQQPSRGLYVLADADLGERQSVAEACKRVQHGVVCLLSALQFHGLTTQIPHEVWLAIDVKARRPKVNYPPLRIVRFSGTALTFGTEEHVIRGVKIKVYGPAKSVADCFKYRNKIGVDVAIEALRDVWRRRRATMDELLEAAKVCRVANVMRPYLESLT